MGYIKIDNVSKDYGQGRGIFNINFEVKKGEVFGYLGPNGAGKTTTIRTLLGFIKADSGQITIDNVNTWKGHHLTNANIGYLPGEINFPSSMNGYEVLKWNAELRNVNDLTLQNELIEYFELKNLHTKVKRMSKGMKQKLGIICAFMHDPDTLILDEPTSGLDPLMQDKFVRLIKKEKEKGKTILMSSHMFNEIENNGEVTYKEVIYDKLIASKQGQVVLKQRSEDEIFKVRCMNKSFVKQYTKWWGKEFQEIRGEEGPFDLARIEDRHKGGFFERYIWHSTSNEYKEMIQAMKDFHNPESEHFGDKVHLKGKANAYIDRKMLRQGYATIDQMKGTSKARTQLALDIIEACDEKVDFDKIENDWYKENEIAEVVEKEQALNANDVEEKPLVEDKQQVKEQVNEIKNEIKNEEEKEIVK